MMHQPFCVRSFLRRSFALPAAGALFLLALGGTAQAGNLVRGSSSLTSSSQYGSSSSTATSQTATEATSAAAQAAQASVAASRSQESLMLSTLAFQKLMQAQSAAAKTAAANNLILSGGSVIVTTQPTTSAINGLAVGGLDPVGGVPATTSPSIQIVDLAGSGKNQLILSNGGTVALPKGTSGSDQVTLSGEGTVTTTAGALTASSGRVTTTTGGTLFATNGGSISLSAGIGTLSSSTPATITSTLAGTVTLPSGGGTVTFSANHAVAVPAGGSVSFSGSGTATVTVSGAGTLTLAGAGTLALSGATQGTITTNTGVTSFTNGAVSSLPAGSTISFTGGGTIGFNGSGNDTLPVILEPTTASAPPAFTTTGTVLNTTGFNLPSLWSGVGALSQSQFTSSTGNETTVVTVTQDQAQALLNWTTFNVGKNTILDFDQSAGGADVGDWVAINRILDPSLAPSQILGTIEAPGQVYVINQNGIIFTGSAQVNTHSLVASTLPMNSNLISDGLLNNPAGQFLFTSIEVPSLNGATAYNPVTDPNVLQSSGGGVSPSGNITVQEGATLSSLGSPEGVGGKIALIAPNIDNEGTLSSPDGQVILAAGQQVGFEAHPSLDPSLRGLDVAVGAGGGTATNGADGFIYAPEADVTMTGLNVNQLGEIESLTSVTLNGRIDLLAVSNLAPDPLNLYIFDSASGGSSVAGTVYLGPNSITDILPDYSSTETEVGTSLALPSLIDIEGGTFHMDQGAQMLAPNATVALDLGILNNPIATTGTTTVLQENTGPGQLVPTIYLSTPGQVELDSGAMIDVSGSSDVQSSVTQNIVSAELTEAVLENSPLQETGALRGQTVQVDISLTGTNADGSTWYGSPIGDLSGYANLIERTVGELTIAGGSVNMNANGPVVLNPNSTINVSGGSIDYQGAMVQTTNLVTAAGNIVNISKATPDQVYQGVYDGLTIGSSKWGVSQTYANAAESGVYYDPSYVQGGNGGSFTINGSSVTLSGSLYGNTTMGARQQLAPPASSSFNLTILSADQLSNPPAVDVVIQPASDSQVSDPNAIYISPDLFGTDGFGNAMINTGSGAITVASDALISTAAGGSFNLTAANIYILGQVYVPSGTVNMTALAKDPVDLLAGNPTPYDSTIGNFDLSSGAVISTSGLTFDETSDVTPGTLPFSVNGGAIAISSALATLASGSVVDASGSVARSVTGKIHDGTGGSISMTGSYNGADGNADGGVVLDGSLSAYGIGGGGSLTLKAPAVQVGGSALQSFPGTAAPLVLPADFFSQGGFSSFSLTGAAGVQVLTGISPVLTEEIVESNGSQFGVGLVSSSQLPSYPAAPVNLSFSAPGFSGSFIGTVTLGTGADIVTGPTASVSFTGQLVNILGGVTAPGGTISVTGDSTEALTGQSPSVGSPDVTVYLGPQAVLDASGVVVSTPTGRGNQTYTTGEVLNGGAITITGNIVGDTGSSLVADGTTGVLDVPTADTAVDGVSAASLATNPYVHETLGSNGGSITLDGIEELYFGGTVSAKAGNPSAIGGTLTIGSGIVASNTAPPNAGYPEIFISQSGASSIGTVTLGNPLPGGSSTGGGYFTVDQFTAGGFGSLVLDGNVEFQTSVTINASQEVKIVPDSQNGTIFANAAASPTIDITAPYIAIGATTLDVGQQSVSNFAPTYVQVESSNNGILQASPVPGLASPTYGAATLSLNAVDLIDVGFLSLQNIGTTNFSVPDGAIRGGGLFYAAGTINLTAGQIYTPTAATFTIAAFSSGSNVGAVNILANPDVALPLPISAGGTINVYATNIDQDGVVEAPFGTINLGALPNSTTGLTPVLAGINVTFDSATQTYQYTPDYTQYAPVTQQLNLGPGSVTSVSGVFAGQVSVVSSSTGGNVVTLSSSLLPYGFGVGSSLLGSTVQRVSGNTVTLTSNAAATISTAQSEEFSDGASSPIQPLELPYGTISNGTDWIAPNGADITAGGLPVKAVNLEGTTVQDSSGALVNLAGGGDIFAYQFNPGVGGTNDILNIDKYADGAVVINSKGVAVASTSFAIVPDYEADYAPIDLTVDSDANYPYANSSLTGKIGDQIYLAGGDGLSAGNYTILPARYALLPDAYLVTPTSGATPTQTIVNPNGSLEMAGYVYNNLNPNQQIVPNVTGFLVDSSAVVGKMAEYNVSQANTFLAASAVANSQPVPRLPQDAGQLVFSATQLLDLQPGATILGNGAAGTDGLGSEVDIASPDNIEINSTGTDASFDGLVLSSGELSGLDANSLLIGGYRQNISFGTVVTVTTNDLLVDNSNGSVLEAGDLILVSNGALTVEAGSSMASSGTVSAQNVSVVNGGTGAVTVASSSTTSTTVTLASSTLPSAFGVGSTLLGATVQSISGSTVTLSADADATVSNKNEPFSGNVVSVASSSASSTTVTLASGTIPADFGVGSSLLGSTVQSINGAAVTLAADANASISNAYEAFSSSDGALLRVSGDTSVTSTRSGGVNLADTAPSVSIAAGATITGDSVILDSTGQTLLGATLSVDAVSINAGRISIELDRNENLQPDPGLVISAATLQAWQTNVQALTLSSYSSIDFYGSGTIGGVAGATGQYPVSSLTLDAGAIRGFTTDTTTGLNDGGGAVVINAEAVTIENTIDGTVPGAVAGVTPAGSLAINSSTINFGANTIAIDGYSTTGLTAANEMVASGSGGLSTQGGLNLITPMITATTGVNFAFNAQGGALDVTRPSSAGTTSVTGGLGAILSLTGTSVSITSAVSAPTGTINVEATTGDITVETGGSLDAGGEAVTFGTATGYTNGGHVNLTSDQGGVTLEAGNTTDGIYPVNVSAPSSGGDAGTVVISVTGINGSFTAGANSLLGTAGSTGSGGNFTLGVNSVSTFSDITNALNTSGFQSLTFDVLTGSVMVDGAVGPALGQTGITSFSLTTEQGGIEVNNTINASGVTGGTIDLYANEGVTLTGNATLTVAARQPNDADEGGLIDIETRGAGSSGGNAIDIESGATLDLTVANPLGNSLVQDGSSTVGGVLHLRAPTTSGDTDLQIDPIDGTITGASSVVLEGYNVYTSTGGNITADLEGSATTSTPGDGTIYGDAELFANDTVNILERLMGLSTAPTAVQMALYQVTPGAEIINPSGNLTLVSNWDLSSFRFGPNDVAGDLTVRAADNLVFTGSLSDGFAYNNSSDSENVANSPYTWDVISGPSWSYRLIAGAQFTSTGASTANYGSVQSLAELGLNTNSLTNASLEAGSLLLGQNIPYNFNFGTLTATTAATYAQIIRTGAGSITIDTGGSVDLLNQLATIYTAGSLAPTITGFDSPTGTSDSKFERNVYSTMIDPAPQYTAQYTEGGENIVINAQQDIAHLTVNSSGELVPDTTWQFPTNWLYRRGATSSTDVFDTTKLNTSEVATTTWWIDFSNFFEGIGALGGGNVAIQAGGNIVNVDAVVPTNARMPTNVPDVASNLVELGGGDLSVIAGGTIEGGTYYVEKGTGTIEANNITSTGDTARISAEDISLGESTPLPLTLFVGDTSFNVEATNDLTIGSTVNPFLLPQGIGNNFNNESIFSTYAANSSVSLSSLLGTIEIQGSETSGAQLPGSLYDAYLSNASPGDVTFGGFREEESLTGTPWTLTLDPTSVNTNFIDNVTDYSMFYELSPPTFNATAFSGNIQYASDQILAPSSQGTMRLLAAGSIDGAFNATLSGTYDAGLTASITILDDNPSQLPSVVNPFGLGTLTKEFQNSKTNPSIDSYIAQVFSFMGETASYAEESLQTLESYHTDGLLHDSMATPPVEIETINGDIGDFTLISPEATHISSGLDLQDVSFYIQNNNVNDISVVAANRDITLYDPTSAGLVDLGAANGNFVAFGDVQISGPGTLEVLAGRNLNLGEGTPPDNAIGTGLGITSIGQSRNPYLPFGGADIIAAAGLGDVSSLSSDGKLNYTAFINDFFNDPSGIESAIYLPDLGTLWGLTDATNSQVWNIFSGTADASLSEQELQIQAELTPEARDALATTIFYDVLRDAGRDHNDPGSSNYGTYTEGYAAIAALFLSGNTYDGNISLTSREIKTTNDGDIDLLAPGGGVNVGLNNLSTQAINQGILTVDGGNISIFANNDVAVGTSRIFTLHGGNIIGWSTLGNIDAGASSRTVQSAPPTQVIVDTGSANVETDLAGLATGGGIGVLETVVGAPPGDVDLIAPLGTVNAGDAGIRSSGNINIAAAQVLNAGNIQAGGATTGVPTTAAPSIGTTVAASSAAGSSQNAASQTAMQQQPNQARFQSEDTLSIISVEVIGYGGGDDDSAYYSPTSGPAY